VEVEICLGGDFSVSRGVELDDEQQRRGREVLEDGEQVGEQVMSK